MSDVGYQEQAKFWQGVPLISEHRNSNSNFSPSYLSRHTIRNRINTFRQSDSFPKLFC